MEALNDNIDNSFDLKKAILNLLREAEKPVAAKELLKEVKTMTEEEIKKKDINSILYKMLQSKEVKRLDYTCPLWQIGDTSI